MRKQDEEKQRKDEEKAEKKRKRDEEKQRAAAEKKRRKEKVAEQEDAEGETDAELDEMARSLGVDALMAAIDSGKSQQLILRDKYPHMEEFSPCAATGTA
eukprot:12558445-Alexandrium_andersonii.AAC.1